MADEAQTPEQRIAELDSLVFGFDDHPLEHFRGLTDEEIEAHGGIGPKYRQRIREGLAELDTLRPPPPPPQPPPAAAPDPFLEPAAPGNSGPLVLVMLVLLVVLVAVTYYFAGGQGGKLRADLATAQAQVLSSQQAMQGLAVELATDARDQTDWVLYKTQARNYGEAMEHLLNVDKSLRALLGAEQAHGVQPARRALLQGAIDALAETRAALTLTAPATHDQVMATCRKLQVAVQMLSSEKVKG